MSNSKMRSGAKLRDRCRRDLGLSGDDDGDDAFADILPRQARGVAPRLGDYELLEELGRGGMGVVFKARQTSLDRVVALKMMLLGGVSRPDALQRFQTEARAAADLDHPNIVRLLDAGQRDGQPFLAMTLVAGRSLADVVRDGIPPAREAAQCVATIARAVEYAHGQGVAQVRDRDAISPCQLNRQIPRDLETICLKCLEKKLAKRYPTAQALADDLDRFLNDEPILARPITRVERAARWCRRKPALASAYGLMLLLLLLLSIASPIAAFRINEARQQAVEQANTARTVTAFLKHEVLELADPTLVRGDLDPDRDLTLAQAILLAGDKLENQFADQPEVEAEIRLTIGRTLLRLDRFPEAERHLSRALTIRVQTSGDNSPAALEVRHELGLLLHRQGRHEEAVASHRHVLALRRQVLGRDDPAVFQSLNALAASLSVDAGNFDEATALYQEVIERGSRALGEEHALVLEAKSGLSQIAYELGHWDEAYRLNEELSR
jgi:tetratricopeptide (TPR) repeat protein